MSNTRYANSARPHVRSLLPLPKRYLNSAVLALAAVMLLGLAPITQAQNTNDDWFRAFPVFRVGSDNTYELSNVGAQADPTPWGDPASCQPQDGQNSVWVSFRPDQTGRVTIDLEGSDFDTIVVLYDGFGNKIACNDDDPSTPGDLTSRIANELVGTSLYLIRITGFNGAQGTSRLKVTGVTGDHPHNESDEAQTIEALDVPYFNFNFNTPPSPGSSERAASCASDSERSVWYRYRPTISAEYQFETTGSLDTVINVWDGNFSSVGNTELACDDDSGSGTNARATVAMQAGRYYYVRASTFASGGAEAGPFRLVPSKIVGTSSEDDATAPTAFALDAAAPNPFTEATQLRFTLATADHTRLAVYDVLGRQVAVLVNEVRAAGAHEVAFDAAGLPAGLYVVRLTTESGEAETRRVTVVR